MDNSSAIIFGSTAALLLFLVLLYNVVAEKNGTPPILGGDISEEATELECEVSKLYTGDDTQTKTNMNYGYVYTPNGAGYGFTPSKSEVVVTEYFVILTDTDNTSILFETDAATYGLLSEGQTISINLVNLYTDEGEQYGNTHFYWGDSKLDFIENVTDKIQATSTETGKAE